MRLYIYHLKNIFVVNFALSILFAAFFTELFSYSKTPFFLAFSLVFTTVGYIVSIVAFDYFGKKTNYMYYNLGISLSRVYMYGFFFNLLFVLGLYLVFEKLWMM